MNSAIDLYRAPSGPLAIPVTEPRAAAPVADRVDLRRLTVMFRRRIQVFGWVFFSVLVIAGGITALMPRRYDAQASVTLNAKLEPVTPTTNSDHAEPAQPAIPSESYVDTQASVITSEANTNAVIDRLDLMHDPLFAKVQGGPAAVHQAVVGWLARNLTVARIATTYGISIDFIDRDPARAARVATAFAVQYTEGALDAKRAASHSTTGVIASRLEQLRQQALADSAVAQRYRIEHNLLSTNQGTLTEQEISAYNQQVAAAKAEAAEDAARLEAAQRQFANTSSAGGVGEAALSPTIGQLRAQQAQIAGEFGALSAHYGPGHPDVIRSRGQLDAVNRQIAAETQRVIASLEAKARASAQRAQSLAGSLDASRGTLARNNAAMVGLNDLEKRAETSNALYESYLNRYKELTAREGTEQADADVLHRAEVPVWPDSPKLVLNAVLGITLALGLGFAAAFLAEMMFTGLTSGDDIEERLGVRYLGSIPQLERKRGEPLRNPASALLEEPRAVFAESFRALRASITLNTTEARIIAITSALPDEGKTTTAICLARSMAAAGDRILLIDTDLRRQGVSRFLRTEDDTRPGLLEVLRGTALLDDALVVDPATGLNILPLAQDATDIAELLTGDEMDRMLAGARERFDAVLIDTAPVLPIADARLVLGKADAGVFVVRWRKTPEAALRSALRMLPMDRVQLAGVALSRVDLRKQARFAYGDDAFYPKYASYYG